MTRTIQSALARAMRILHRPLARILLRNGIACATFALGAFTVDYSTADVSDLTGGTVISGMQVEVEGSLAGSTITTTPVHDDGLGDNVAKVSVEGIVTDFVASADFRVAGMPVNASGSTLVPAALLLANDMEVEVEGRSSAAPCRRSASRRAATMSNWKLRCSPLRPRTELSRCSTPPAR